jgi:(p)ppGpp synthase/HD superfamily hydrolase
VVRPPKADKRIEDGIKYLVNEFQSTGDNPKPVILHTMRLAMDLYRRGYETRIVVAALLHDLIEDTAITPLDIREEFGEQVLEIVEATTFDETIEDRYDRFKDTFRRCKEQGREALVVKAADILDNSDYYHLASTEEDRQYLVDKMQHFIDVAASKIGEEPIHIELKEKLAKVKSKLETINNN